MFWKNTDNISRNTYMYNRVPAGEGGDARDFDRDKDLGHMKLKVIYPIRVKLLRQLLLLLLLAEDKKARCRFRCS